MTGLFAQIRLLLQRRFRRLFAVLLCLCLLPAAYAQAAPRVYVIPLKGTVDPGMAAFLNRALDKTDPGDDTWYVFKIDTFGGRVDAALEIVDTLLTRPRGTTIAYVHSKAISAGALIALACNKLVMQHHTTIGDCAPITYSNEGPRMMGEKFQSPLRAKFRSLARRNHYPETLAEAMVTEDMVVYRVRIDDKIEYLDQQAIDNLSLEQTDRIVSKQTVVAKGELLTMDDIEAHQYGFSQMSVAGLDEMLREMGLQAHETVTIEETWSVRLVRFIGTIAPILMMIGLAALYTEIKAPGFGLPGMIGIILLGLVFFNQYLIGLADYVELLVVCLGILLLGFEIFVIPGFGIAGIAGLLCIAAGLLLALQDFVIPDPSFPWQGRLLIRNIVKVCSSLIGAFLMALFVLRYVMPRVARLMPGPYLDATLEAAHADSSETGQVCAGASGIAATLLRPAGKARLGSDIVDVITEGDFIEKDAPIVVAAIRGNRIIVKRKDGP